MIILRDLARRLPDWDAPAKCSLALALLLLALLLALGLGGPQDARLPARVGAFGLLISLQILFLWANRREISPYHEARERFIAGDYRAARAILEGLPVSSRISVDALALLGTTYRHLGLFDKSGAALDRAIELKPNHHLALFSRGKLMLVQGAYAGAVEFILKALETGAPNIVRFELGLAYHLLQDEPSAVTELETVREIIMDDLPLRLMTEYILYKLHKFDASELPNSELARGGLGFWREEATIFDATPYGQAVRHMVREMEALILRAPEPGGITPASSKVHS